MFGYAQGCPAGPAPCGVVLLGSRGRVVFERPVLLPDEQFIPVDLLQGRAAVGQTRRLRLPRSR